MSDLASSTPQTVASEQAEYEAAWNQAMAEVNSLNALMQQDRADIDRLRAETWALRAETRAVLAGMGMQV